jgi:hypothetical protein
MIRFLGAFVVALVLLGSVALCQYGLTRTVEVELTREADGRGRALAAGTHDRYRLVLNPTFDVRDDPFALDTGAAGEVRLMVRAGTRELVRWTDDVVRGQTIEVDDVVLAGDSVELFVEATPTGGEASAQLALRVQVLQDGVVFADETLWTPGEGAPLSQRVTLELKARRGSLDRGLGEGAP